MNIKIIKLMSAVCVALAVLLAVEWITAKFALSRLLDSERSSSSRPYQLDDVPALDLTGKSEEFYSDMVSRPLFIQGRRPVAEAAPELAGGAIPGTDAFDWQLIGIFTVKNSLTALFGREKNPVPKDNFRKLKVDGDLDGWKLTEIHKDKVILVQEGSEPKSLPLRKPKPKQLPPNQAPAPDQAPARARAHRRINLPRPAAPQASESKPDSEPEPTETEPEPESEISEDASENSDNE
ncbi:MAG: hypothetical protein ACU841_07850 [Gammaproteobacteria bacterium]